MERKELIELTMRNLKRNNMDLICIVLGADTKKDRTRDSIELIEYAFKTFFPYNIKEKIEWAFTSSANCFITISRELVSPDPAIASILL